ncbi:MAG: LamG-like jellyroll fold domain-containing protein, partial [Burkholderiales bacterium]
MTVLRKTLVALAAVLAATCAHAQVAFRSAASASAAVGASATVAYAGVGTVATGSGNCTQTLNPGIPGGTAAGDLLIASVTAGDTYTLTMNGWSVLYANAQGGYQAAVYWRIATGGDPTTITKTGTPANGCNVMIARISRFTGVDTSSPFDGGVGASYQNANTVTTGSITTTNATSMLVISAHTNDDSDTGVPAGFTEAWDSQTTTGNDVSVAIKYQAQTTAGNRGAYSMSKTRGSDPNHGILFALRPAPNDLTINKPAGTISGDVMLAFITVRDSSVQITPPAGWSSQAAVVQNAGASSRQQLFYKVAGGAEPANYTWTFDSAHQGAAGAIATYSGVDTTTPIDAYGGNTTPQGADSNLQHRALAVTTLTANTEVVTAHTFSSSATWTPPAGMTERVDIASQAVPNATGVSLEVNDVAQAAVGTTGAKLATASGDGDTGIAQIVALRPIVVQPVLAWSMDQASWNGTAGEVIDSSGNNLNGRAVNGTSTLQSTPAIPGNPGTCRYGNFDGVDDYVEVANNALLNITDELTVMMWLRPTVYPTGGNLKSFVSKDNNYEAHLNSGGHVYWWWGGAPQELTSAGTVPLNTWTHVALVYSRAGAFQRIYINGVQDTNANNQSALLATNTVPFQIGGDQGFAGREWQGLVDEVYVFHSALSQTRIQQYMALSHACAVVMNHFAISDSGSGVGCTDQPITITAHDAAHNPADAGGLTIALSTSNGKGTWTGVQSGGGALNDPVAGDGAATYIFPLGSTEVTLLFRYSNQTTATETFNFNVSGGGFTEHSGTATAADDPNFTMSQAGFRFRNVEDANETFPVQISGKPSNTGFNARTLRVQAINTNTSSGACVSLFASQSQSVDLGAECNNPTSCQGRQVSVNGSNIATSIDNAGAGATSYTPVSLAFNASSEADVVLSYPDAGQISLHARYDLNPLIAGYEMVGSSNTFIERPFGLAFPGVSHQSTATGTVLAAAGDNFSMTVQGFQWAAGEDANNDGVPDAG